MNLSQNEKEDGGLPKEKLADYGTEEEDDAHDIIRKRKEHLTREEMQLFTGSSHQDHEEELQSMRKRLDDLKKERKCKVLSPTTIQQIICSPKWF